MSFISNSSAAYSREGQCIRALESVFGKSRPLNKMFVTPLLGSEVIPYTNTNFDELKKSIAMRFAAIQEAPGVRKRIKEEFGPDFSEKIFYKQGCEWVLGCRATLEQVLQSAENGNVEISTLQNIEKELVIFSRCKKLAERALGKGKVDVIFSLQPFSMKHSIAEVFLEDVMLRTEALIAREENNEHLFQGPLMLDVPGYDEKRYSFDEASTDDAFSDDSELVLDEDIFITPGCSDLRECRDPFLMEEGPLDIGF